MENKQSEVGKEMNQPKFKFGERVQRKELVFNISHCYWDNGFYYSGPGVDTYFQEHELESCQEPQEKKLYAYYQVDSFDRIVFHSSEIGDVLKDLVREPKYDIEYPEAN